jgi:hypothetical protein
VSEIATLDVGVQTEEAAKRNAPFNWSEGVGISENVLALQVVELFYLQSIVLFAHYYYLSTKINRKN